MTYNAEEDGDGEEDERGHHEHEGEAARDEEAEGAEQVGVHLGGLVHLRLDRLSFVRSRGARGLNECTVEGGRVKDGVLPGTLALEGGVMLHTNPPRADQPSGRPTAETARTV